MGSLLTVSFTDPDEGWHEVVWTKPGISSEATTKLLDWETIKMD